MERKTARLTQKITLTNRVGVCPICASTNLDFGYNDISDEWMCSEWKCPECKATGRQCYKIQFDTHDEIFFEKVPGGTQYYISDLKHYGVDADDEQDVDDDIPESL